MSFYQERFGNMIGINKKKARFTEIYSDYYSIIFGAIYSKIGKVDIANDLAQDVFIRFYEGVDDIDEIKNVRSWLFGIMKNVLREHYRKKEKRKESEIPDDNNDIAMSYVNAFRDTRYIIEQAISDIEESTDRKIFDLVAVQNYTYEETGELLGFSKRQVKYKYSLIVKYILGYLREKGINNLEDLL